MPSALPLAGDIATSAGALAGLILIFLGAISNRFDSYDKAGQNVVRGRYQRRAWFAFVGFVLALFSASLAIVGKWLAYECAALSAVVLFLIALVWLLFVALFAIREIK